MSKGYRSLVAGVALAVGLALSTASEAAAADGWQATADVSDGSYSNGYAKECTYSGDQVLFDTGQGCFQPYGDWVWIRDLDANGIPVGISWSYYPPAGSGGSYRSGVIYNSAGKDSGWGNLNKNFVEGGTFSWQTCEVNVSTGRVYSGTCSESNSMRS